MKAGQLQRSRAGMPALDLIEAAVSLLRRTPPGAFLAWAIGTVPFWLALLFFVSDMTQNAYARRHISEAALALGFLFIWMKCWQTVFAARLRSTIANRPPEPWASPRIGRLVAAQALWQPLGLVLRILAAQVLIPYIWIASFCQNLTVLGDGSDEGAVAKRAWAQARLWPAQTHLASLAVWIFSLFVWLNVMLALGLAPAGLKMFLGIETAFSRSLEAMLNSTFITMSLALTAMALDPLWKAIFVVRCFQGSSLRTGEDLRVRLRDGRGSRRAALIATLAVGFLLADAGAAEVRPATAQPVATRKLDHHISEVLERREYAWRAPREKLEESEKGILSSWVNGAIRMLERTWKTGKKILGAIADALFGRSGPTGAGMNLKWMPSMMVAFMVGLLVVAVGWLVWRLLVREKKAAVIQASALPIPDLHSEDVLASQLPEEQWIELARRYARDGELTLALRAAWLASLAHLGERELLGIARHKSNRDYARELRRRARARGELLAAFGQNLDAFERAWYGRHEVESTGFSTFERNLERIREC